MSKVTVASSGYQEFFPPPMDMAVTINSGRTPPRTCVSAVGSMQNLRDAFHRYGPPSGMPLHWALNMISHRRARELRYVNPHARWWWLHYLHDAYRQWTSKPHWMCG